MYQMTKKGRLYHYINLMFIGFLDNQIDYFRNEKDRESVQHFQRIKNYLESQRLPNKTAIKKALKMVGYDCDTMRQDCFCCTWFDPVCDKNYGKTFIKRVDAESIMLLHNNGISKSDIIKYFGFKASYVEKVNNILGGSIL